MSQINLGNIDNLKFVLGEEENIQLYLGEIKLYPLNNYKYEAKYTDGSVYHLDCDSQNSLTSADTRVNAYANVSAVTVGNCVTEIRENSFRDFESLSKVKLPKSLTTIGDSAFYGCSGLTEVVIPSSVTSIGTDCFSGCTSLTSIKMESVTPPTLGNVPFAQTNDCPIYIPCDSTDAYTADANWNEYASRFVEYGCPRTPDGYTELQYCTVPKVANTSQSFMIKSKNNVAYDYTISFMPIGWETDSYYKFLIGGGEGYPPSSMFSVFSLDNGWFGGRWIINGLGYTMDSREGEFTNKTTFHDNVNASVTMCYNERQQNNGMKITIENEGYDTYTGVSTIEKTGSGTKVDYDTEYDIPLFTTYNNADFYTPNMRFYNFKVYDTVNETDVYHYVPVKRDSDNTVGICDIVSQNVYFPPTHIVLTAGPEVQN